jgi:8-oxo-dGTP diphosphatase
MHKVVPRNRAGKDAGGKPARMDMTGRQILPAVSVALQHDDRLLLVLRGRAPSLGYYAFPGGRVEQGETLEEAARRELAEETGLTAGPLSPLVRVAVEGDEVDYDLHVFYGRYAGGEPVAADDAAEARFFTLVEMESLRVLDSVLEVGRGLLRK